MDNENSSLEEWRKVYQAAIKFKTLKCWEWMYDSDIFGVQNPETGEIGYCCVMGNLGQVFALTVYLGSDGLDGYLKTASGEIGPNDINLLHLQNCLMVSFENREYLTKVDREIIKALGLKFRGMNEWPLFRNYKPGYRPWYLNRSEVTYLTLVLEQAQNICQRFKEYPGLFKPPRKGLYFVRVPERKDNTIYWRDDWLRPRSLHPKKKPILPLDEIRLRRIKKNVRQSNRIWELDYFYSPFGINEGKRPYFPYIFLLVDHDSYEIINFHLTGHSDYEPEFLEKFLNTVESVHYLPRSLMVKREETYHLFLEVTQKLGIRICFKDTLVSLEEAQENMFDYFSKKF